MGKYDEIRYEKYIVAFLDILGFSSHIRSISKNEESLKSTMINKYFNLVSSFSTDGIEVKVMSDAIVVAVKLGNRVDAINKIINTVSGMQCRLAAENIWIRGAITEGKMFFDNDFVVGDGLVKAYNLESNHAKYPRVIIDPLLIKSFGGGFSFLNDVLNYGNYVYMDGAEAFEASIGDLPFVDIISQKLHFSHSPLLRDNSLSHISYNLADSLYSPAGVYEKYFWFKKYFESVISFKLRGLDDVDSEEFKYIQGLIANLEGIL